MGARLSRPGTGRRAEVLGRAADPQYMLAKFQRALPGLASSPIRVTACTAKVIGTRRGRTSARRRVLYRVTVESLSGIREHVLVGTVPVTSDFLSPELLVRCRTAGEQAASAPFEELALFLEELEMALVFLPVDPALPGLVEITGRRGPALLAAQMREQGDDVVVESLAWSLRRYRPSRHCVLRLDATLRNGAAAPTHRNVYVEVFADSRGAVHYENLRSVWRVAARAQRLAVPEPLGYDEEHRLLFLGEARGGRTLAGRIRELTDDDPDKRSDVERCLAGTAEALAELQASDLVAGEERSFRGELAALHRHADRLRDAHPDVAAQVAGLLERLSASSLDEERLVPAHGRLDHRRVAVGDPRRTTILDWGGLCLAPPALDPAVFINRLRLGAASANGHGQELARRFRREYLRRADGVTADELPLFEALVLATSAVRGLRGGDRGAGRAAQLLRLAGRILEGRAERR